MYLQEDALLLCHVGDVRNGIDESLVQSTDVPLRRLAKHDIMLALIFSAVLACAGSAHHNIMREARLYLFSAACAVILLMVVLVFTFDWHDQKSCIVVLLLVLLIYSYGTIAALNRGLDRKPINTESAVVIDKYSSGSTKARNRNIVVHTESGEESYEVSISQYQAAQPGDEVLICRHQGWLDIPYATIQFP